MIQSSTLSHIKFHALHLLILIPAFQYILSSLDLKFTEKKYRYPCSGLYIAVLYPCFCGKKGCESYALGTNEQSKQVLQLETVCEGRKKTNKQNSHLFSGFFFCLYILARCHASILVLLLWTLLKFYRKLTNGKTINVCAFPRWTLFANQCRGTELSQSREAPLSILIMRRFVGLYFNNYKILPTGFLMSALFIFRAKFRKSWMIVYKFFNMSWLLQIHICILSFSEVIDCQVIWPLKRGSWEDSLVTFSFIPNVE